MKKKYRYVIRGIDSNGNSWTTTGTIEANPVEQAQAAMRDSFLKLTSGEAVYGEPGIGCSGPYQIESILITLVKEQQN